MHEPNLDDAPEQAPARRYTGNHAVAALFHALFKGAALLLFFLKGFMNSYVISFVVIVLLLAADFWTVKNVTGRIMVGLRWWNDIAPDGKSEWRFEAGDPSQVHECDKRFFWLVLILNVALWAVFLIVNVIGLAGKWIPLVVLGMVLGGTNAYGYIKCVRQGKSMRDVVRDSVVNYAVANPELAAGAARQVFSVASRAATSGAGHTAPPV